MLGSPQQTQLPDLIEPIKGWRSWNLVRSYGRWLLESPDLKAVWAPGQAVYAHCTFDHETQDEREACNCGINAFASQSQLVESGYGERAVIGEVDLWGEVTKYESGWRGQWAKPAGLIVQMAPGEIALQVALDLEAAYGVEVIVRSPGETAEAAHIAAPAPAASAAATAAPMDDREASRRTLGVRCVGIAAIALVLAGLACSIYLRLQRPNRVQQLRDGNLVTSHSSDDVAHCAAALGLPLIMAAAAGIAGLLILRIGRARMVNEKAVPLRGQAPLPAPLISSIENWYMAVMSLLAIPFLCALITSISLSNNDSLDVDSVQRDRVISGKALTISGAKDAEAGRALSRIAADVKLADGDCKVAKAPLDDDGADLRVRICRDQAKLTFNIP